MKIWLALFVANYFAIPLLIPIFQRQAITNYTGDAIPQGLGFSFISISSLVMVTGFNKHEFTPYFAVTVLFFAFLGIIDDSLGDEKHKGWQSHFTAWQLTTGSLKAVAGIAFALALASLFSKTWFTLLLNGSLIALSSNLLNIFDLRPGRASKVFILLATPLLLLNSRQLIPLQWLLASLLGYLPWDLRGRVMMGDSGANALGAALGLALVISLSAPWKLVFAILFFTLNLLAEKYSFSKIIAESPILDFFDQLGR